MDMFWSVIEKLSWLSAISIPFVIYALDRRREIRSSAKNFIDENYDEKHCLALAMIAANIYPNRRQHHRKIYNEFVKLPVKIQKEVIKREKIGLRFPSRNWVKIGLKKLLAEMNEQNLVSENSNMFYDDFKYFHRTLTDYGGEMVLGIDPYIFSWKKPTKMQEALRLQSSIRRYLEEFIDNQKSRKPEQMEDPATFFIERTGWRTTEEKDTCFWTTHFIWSVLITVARNASNASIYEDYLPEIIPPDDELYEDYYYCTLLLLFAYYKSA